MNGVARFIVVFIFVFSTILPSAGCQQPTATTTDGQPVAAPGQTPAAPVEVAPQQRAAVVEYPSPSDVNLPPVGPGLAQLGRGEGDNALRPVPGSLASTVGLEERQKLVVEAKKVIDDMAKKGEKLSGYFPKMLRTAELMKIQPTDTVADIGAGTGLFAVALLEAKISFAKLFAVEIDYPSLDLMKYFLEGLQLEGRDKVVPIYSTPTDVKLEENSVDKAVFINSPFYLAGTDGQGEYQVSEAIMTLFSSLFKAVKPGGKVYVLEMAGQDVEPTIDPNLIIKPFEKVGFTLESQEVLQFSMAHYFMVFVKK